MRERGRIRELVGVGNPDLEIGDHDFVEWRWEMRLGMAPRQPRRNESSLQWRVGRVVPRVDDGPWLGALHRGHFRARSHRASRCQAASGLQRGQVPLLRKREKKRR